MRRLIVFAVGVIGTWSALADEVEPCAIRGEPIQWVTDYCMLRMQTDDEIAVADCIDEESQHSFSDDCAGKLHFKARMCETAIDRGTRTGTLAQCVDDPAFQGRIVASGGVGS